MPEKTGTLAMFLRNKVSPRDANHAVVDFIDPRNRQLLVEFIGPAVASAVARAQARLGAPVHFGNTSYTLMMLALMLHVDNMPDIAAARNAFNACGTSVLHSHKMALDP